MYKTHTYIFALRKTTTQLTVYNIFISILFDYTKKACQKNPALFTFLPILALEALLLHIGHYFLPIDYIIFILTQRLVTVAKINK